MDTETLKYLLALRQVNKALMDGLKAAIFVLEKEKELTPERRKSMIESLKTLVSQSEEIYGEAPTKH
ncbi:hypothetical protein ES703_110687 [subsurface metagenome]